MRLAHIRPIRNTDLMESRNFMHETGLTVSKRATLTASVAVAAAVIVFAALMALNVGGHTVTTAIDDFGEAAAALLGAAGCWYAATHHRRHDRRAWWLLGAACFSWAIGEMIWSLYEVGGNRHAPFPSYADIAFLGESVLAAIALLAFGTVRLAGLSRVKMLLDGALVASSLLFLSWVVLLEGLYRMSMDSTLAQVIGLAYPVGDVLIITLAVMLMLHAPTGARTVYGLIGCGILATAVSDSLFAYMTTAGTYANATNVASTGWFLGFLLVGLAGLLPERKHRSSQPKLPGYFEIMLPYGAIAVAAGATFVAVGFKNDVAFWLSRITIVLALTRLLLGSLQNLRHIHVLEAQARLLEQHFARHPHAPDADANTLQGAADFTWMSGQVRSRRDR
jgi:two-component system, sensor histidine kinase and response regulator